MDCVQQVSQVFRGSGGGWIAWILTALLVLEISWWVVLRRRDLSEPTRALLRVIRHGVLWALVLGFISVPFGPATPFIWIGGPILLGVAYVVARYAGKSIPFLRYTAKEFIALLLLAGALAVPFWISALATLMVVTAAVHCVKTIGY